MHCNCEKTLIGSEDHQNFLINDDLVEFQHWNGGRKLR